VGDKSLQRENDPAQLVLSNAIDFLNVGLTILYSSEATSSEAKVAIISIQTAIELLAKYKLIREFGLSSIVSGKVPDEPIELASRKGNLRTIGYGACLKKIQDNEGFSTTEFDLVHRLQNLRNSLVHFAADVDVEEIQVDAAWMLIRALGMFAAGHERDVGDFESHRRFLSDANFKTLTNFRAYRDEAVDSAIESIDSDQVFRCWECGDGSMSLRVSGTFFCHCCGLSVVGHAVAYVDCPSCKAVNGVCYDPLNSASGMHYGKCLYCDEKFDDLKLRN